MRVESLGRRVALYRFHESLVHTSPGKAFNLAQTGLVPAVPASLPSSFLFFFAPHFLLERLLQQVALADPIDEGWVALPLLLGDANMKRACTNHPEPSGTRLGGRRAQEPFLRFCGDFKHPRGFEEPVGSPRDSQLGFTDPKWQPVSLQGLFQPL